MAINIGLFLEAKNTKMVCTSQTLKLGPKLFLGANTKGDSNDLVTRLHEWLLSISFEHPKLKGITFLGENNNT